MSAGYARVGTQWERIAGSAIQLGTGPTDAARGDHTHPDFPRHAQYSLIGGGKVAYLSNNYFYWSSPFYVNAGRNPQTASAGLFQIDMPMSGAPNMINCTGKAWSTSGFGIILNNWETLYYALPLGGGQASVPGNFYVVYYYGTDFVVPEHWIMIATRSGDAAGHVKVGTGVHLTNIGTGSYWAPDTGWIAPTLLNGWVNYGGQWETAAYRRRDGMVYLRGLITGGTASTFFNLPVGFRPGGNTHSPTMGHNSTFGIVNLYTDGRVNYNTSVGGLGYFSLQVPGFPADN